MNDIIVKPLSLDLSLSRSQLLLLVKQEINISTFQLDVMSVSSELAFDSHHRINITMLIRLSFVAQCLAEVHVQF